MECSFCLYLGVTLFTLLNSNQKQLPAPRNPLHIPPLTDHVQSCHHVEQRHSGASTAATLL